jgi:hypothetical protein
MRRYQLGEVYHRLRAAVRNGQPAQASRLLGEALGVELPAEPLPARLPVRLRPMLSYRGVKPAELAMIAADLKPVVKLEDLPIAQAAVFTRRYRDQFRILQSDPYRKDYLLLRSSPAVADAHALVSLYVSRGPEAEQLRALEQGAREDFHGAGGLLGFPRCCVDAFAADFAHSRADQDTLNDDACRRLLASCDAPDAAVNPLSDHELLAYYPCRLDCSASLARAHSVARALDRSRPGTGAQLPHLLGAPTVFWRLPFFGTLRGRWQDGHFELSGIDLNAFPDPEVARIQQWWARHLAGLLAPGARLQRRGEILQAALPDGGPIELGDGLLLRWQQRLLATL